jgi:hypothetical protein
MATTMFAVRTHAFPSPSEGSPRVPESYASPTVALGVAILPQVLVPAGTGSDSWCSYQWSSRPFSFLGGHRRQAWAGSGKPPP